MTFNSQSGDDHVNNRITVSLIRIKDCVLYTLKVNFEIFFWKASKLIGFRRVVPKILDYYFEYDCSCIVTDFIAKFQFISKAKISA